MHDPNLGLKDTTKRRMRVNQKAITGFLEENYKAILFYIVFAVGLFFFFYALMSRFPGGGKAPGFFQFIYNEIAKGTIDGVWGEYPSGGKLKHVYVKKTSNELFVTSGYFR